FYGGFYPGYGFGFGYGYPGYWGYGSPGYWGYGRPYYGYAPYYYSTPYVDAYGGAVVATTPSTVTESLYRPAAAPAAVTVTLPTSDAQVWFEGVPMRQTGAVRQFTSPPLDPAQSYHYTVRAVWNEGDRTVDQTRTVTVA